MEDGKKQSSSFHTVDAENEDPNIVAALDSAATYGWKVKIVYHETFGKNWFGTRGETNHFVKSVDVLDRNPVGSIFNGENGFFETITLFINKHIIEYSVALFK